MAVGIRGCESSSEQMTSVSVTFFRACVFNKFHHCRANLFDGKGSGAASAQLANAVKVGSVSEFGFKKPERL